MIVNEIKGMDVKIYHEELENGLNVYLIPYENRNNYYVEYGVKYGAEIDEFISLYTHKKTKMPYGVAHFLEHKMFEQEDGVDPFSYFSQSGTEANASTGYRMTSYTIEGTNNLLDNLNYLLSYVNSPYFTDENVEKEKGIIIEELNMYKDQPENVLFEASNKALFKKHPIRRDVGGTPKSVKKINKEILYECYDTFYQPNNMFLVIAGNLNIDEVMNTIKNNKKLNAKKNNGNIKIFKVKEPLEVNIKNKVLKIKNMVNPKFILSIKCPMEKLEGVEKYKYMLCAEFLLYILFGMSSEFREEMLNKDYYSIFYSSSSAIDNFFIYEFICESKYPKEMKEEILNCLKNKNISKDDVERVKKVRISIGVVSSDFPYKMLDMIIDNIIEFGEVIYNRIDIIKSITLEDILKVRNNIILDNYSFVIGYSKE